MKPLDWYEGFLFEEAENLLTGLKGTFSLRAFRIASYSEGCLTAFNAIPALIKAPGVREEAAEALARLGADNAEARRILISAGL